MEKLFHNIEVYIFLSTYETILCPDGMTQPLSCKCTI